MKFRYVVILLVVAAVIYGVVRYISREHPVEVTVKKVDRGTVEATVANTRAGTVEARHRARLAPAIGGQIATLDVHKGDQVKAGQQLLTLWNDDIRAQLKLAREEVAAAETLAREACLMAEFAGRDAKRLTELRRKKSASESAYDQAVTTAAARQIACETAGIQVAAGKARIETVEAQLDRTILRAPFAGIVAEVNGEIGEFITPSPTGIATLPAIDLINLEELYVTAPIDEMDAAQIRPGMKVRISLDAFPDQMFAGKVLQIAPYVLEQAKQARTVEVECVFHEQERPGNLLAGYSTDVEIILDVRKNVLRIPTEALLEDGTVYVLDKNTGRVEQRQVTGGLANWRFTEAVSGLKEGDLLVTSLGREGLRDGAKAVIEENNGAGQQ